MSQRGWLKRAAGAVALAVALPLGVTVVGGGAVASAAFDPSAQDFWANSDMGPIKNRIWRAADGNTDRVVYLLDGLRATDDLSGWEKETNVGAFLAANNINVVQPVGGACSFYSDWQSISSIGTQDSIFRWETYISDQLPTALQEGLGFSPVRNGVIGLSMGGSSALAMAAYHPQQFSYAATLSGYLNLSAPGMRSAIGVAMLDAGPLDVNAMWGPLGSDEWTRNDPYMFAPILKQNNTRVWVSAGTGIPAAGHQYGPGVQGQIDVASGAGLEVLSLATSRAFQSKMNSIGATNITYAFEPAGIHSWQYWEDQVHKLVNDLGANIG
jgi:diacylglycerol O-acyltransferase/trehalose O-mycolyltransferase